MLLKKETTGWLSVLTHQWSWPRLNTLISTWTLMAESALPSQMWRRSLSPLHFIRNFINRKYWSSICTTVSFVVVLPFSWSHQEAQNQAAITNSTLVCPSDSIWTISQLLWIVTLFMCASSWGKGNTDLKLKANANTKKQIVRIRRKGEDKYRQRIQKQSIEKTNTTILRGEEATQRAKIEVETKELKTKANTLRG